MLKKEFIEKLKEYEGDMLHKEENSDGEFFYTIKYCSFGDYDNSCAVERANYREMRENKLFEICDWLDTILGAYNYEAIIIELYEIETAKIWTKRDQETADWIIGILSGLSDYPAINDESVSLIEMEMQDEAWENCYESDFISELHKLYSGKYFFDFNNADFSSGNLRELFEKTVETINEYWIIESGGSAHINFRTIALAFPIEKANNVFFHDFSVEKIGDVSLLEELGEISLGQSTDLVSYLENYPDKSNPAIKIIIEMLNN